MSFFFPTRDEAESRAQEEARQIREYWKARGYIVNTAVSYAGVDKDGRPLFRVQTDTVNGMPIRRAG